MSAALLAFLASPIFFTAGNAVWNLLVGMVVGVMGETPQGFSTVAWNYVTGTAYPVALSVGTLLLNLIFLAGFFMQASDLKKGMTIEMLLELAIKTVFANVLMQSGLSIMQGLFSGAAGLSGAFVSGDLNIAVQDIDAGTTLFACIFGMVYFLVCLVCAALIFISVYGRMIQLYVLVVCAPLALPFIAGGNGLDRTGYSFIRAFLGKCFEIVVIALFLGVGVRLCNSIDWGTAEGVLGWFDGAGQCVQSMMTMVLMAASVKGAEGFMRHVFSF